MNTTNQLSDIEQKVREITKFGICSKHSNCKQCEVKISELLSLITTTQKEAYKKVNRVEVIDHTLSVPKGGRIYVKWEDKLNVEADLQDNDRTLKIFISTPKEGEETK